MKQPNFAPICKKKKKKKKKRHDYDNVVVCIPTHSSALSTIFASHENRHPAEMMMSSFLEKEEEEGEDDDDKIEAIRSNSNNTQPTITCFCRDISDANGAGDRLYIQCHYDRIIWNFFHPLFIHKQDCSTTKHHASCDKNTDDSTGSETTATATTNTAAMHAIEIIIHAFETFIIKQQQQLSSPSRYWNRSMANKDTKEQSNMGNDATTTMQPWNEQLWNSQKYQFTTTTSTAAAAAAAAKTTVATKTKDSNSSPTKILYLILLPVHYPIQSPHFHNNNSNSNDQYHPQSHKLYTEQLFTSALVRQENLYIKLQTLNAFIATMGGGYFLCRYLNTAIKLARYQRLVALALDDVPLAMKCTINEAYNYIHAGQIDRAKRLILKTWKQAKERVSNKEENMSHCNDDAVMTVAGSDSMNVILGMCRSALWFAKGVERAGLKEDTMEQVTPTAATGSTSTTQRTSHVVQRQATRDDFLRIRIVTSK